MNKQRIIFTVAGLLSHASYINAQESAQQPLEEIKVVGKMSLYSATKSDTPILEVARSISIETKDSLVDIGALELADAYTYSSGVTGEAFGFSTRGDWVRVRGLDVPQYQDSLQSLFGNYNNTRPEVYTLEQVEILKGPASVLYGQGSPGGIVNVVSKRPRADAENEIVASFGTFDYRQVAVDVGGKLDSDGHWLYRLVGLSRDSETQVNFVEDNVLAISPSISYQPSDDTSITLLLNYQDATSDAGAQFLPVAGTLNAAPNGQFFESDLFVGEPGFSQYDGTTKSASILADHRFNDTWSMQFTARRTEGERDYSQAWIAFSFSQDRFVRNSDGSLYEGGSVPRSFYQSEASSEQQAADLRFRADFETGGISHELMLGGQLQDVTTDEDSSYAYALGYSFATAGPDQTFGDTFWINPFNPTYGNVPSQAVFDAILNDAPTVKVKDVGLYVNDQMTFGNWHWNVGLRHDDISNENGLSKQDDNATSFATGFLYAFDNGVSPYASYAESFEPVVGLDVISQQAFEPQEGEQVEVGIKYSFANSANYFTIAYFDIEQSNLLTLTPIGQTQSGGIDTVSGVEFESKFAFGDFQLEVNASKLDSETEAGFQFSSVPETNASLWLGYGERSENGFRAGFGARYAGESFGGNDVIETPSYALVDAMVAYKMESWTFRLNARNLSDKEYQSSCLSRGDCFQGERRTVVGTVGYSF